MPTRSPASLRHRRSLWIGLGTLILLTVSWISSIGQFESSIGYSSKFHLSFGHYNERIFLAASTQGGWHLGFEIPKDQFPFKSRPQIFRMDSDLWVIIIPYWLILTLFLIGWASFLIWRTRTIHKHLNERPPLPFFPMPDPPHNTTKNLPGL